jgi:hypothetical protein
VAIDVPRFPNGLVRLGDDGIVEVTGPEPTRIPAADVRAIEIGEPKKGRVAVRLKYTAGISNNTEKFLIDEANAPVMQELLAAVRAAGGAPA